MAPYFDYSPPQVPDQAEGLAALGDAVTGIIKRRQQQQQFEQEQAQKNKHEERLFNAQQNQYHLQQTAQDNKAAREAADFGVRQTAQHRADLEAIRKASANPQLQEAIAAGSKTFDPATGKEIGHASIERAPLPDLGPAPTAPQSLPPEVLARRRGAAAAAEAPFRPLSEGPQPDPGAFIGPIPSNEESWRSKAETAPERDATLAARQGYESRAAAAADQAKQDAAAESDFARASAAFPGEQGAYQARSKAAEMNRPFTVTMGPGETPVTFDPATQRYRERTYAYDDFMESLRGVNLGPNGQDAAARAGAAILAGADPQKVYKGFDEEIKLGVKADYGEQLQSQKDKEAYKRAMIPKPGFVLQERKFNFDQGKEQSKNIRQDLKTFAERYGAKTIQEDHLQIPRIEDDLKSDNPGRQRNAMVQLWQMAQHDHRFSDQDAVMSQTVDPSWLAQISNYVSRGTTGVLDPGVQQTAIDTARSFGKYLSSKNAQMRSLAKRDFIDSGEYDQHEADVLLGEQLPGWSRLFGERQQPGKKRRGIPEVDKKTKVSGDPDAVEKLLKAAEGLLK